jgi:hypothetical protein
MVLLSAPIPGKPIPGLHRKDMFTVGGTMENVSILMEMGITSMVWKDSGDT